MRVRLGGRPCLRFCSVAARGAHDDGWRYALATQKCASGEEVDMARIFSMTPRILMVKGFRTPTR